MTWGKVIDVRRALALYFVLAFILVLGLVLCLSVLANVQIISTNSDSLISPLSMLSRLI
ncbi:MAG: hypothetical protein H6631_07435 [Anaerolineaceae bacterium]|nr:hypothetical protein [Anaerolineaceae bacterium]MCB9097969.1 hypothetical protein [Anaerolineales bacterium]